VIAFFSCEPTFASIHPITLHQKGGGSRWSGDDSIRQSFLEYITDSQTKNLPYCSVALGLCMVAFFANLIVMVRQFTSLLSRSVSDSLILQEIASFRNSANCTMVASLLWAIISFACFEIDPSSTCAQSTQIVILWFGVPLACWLAIAMADSLLVHAQKYYRALRAPIPIKLRPISNDITMGNIMFGGINTQPQQIDQGPIIPGQDPKTAQNPNPANNVNPNNNINNPVTTNTKLNATPIPTINVGETPEQADKRNELVKKLGNENAFKRLFTHSSLIVVVMVAVGVWGVITATSCAKY